MKMNTRSNETSIRGFLVLTDTASRDFFREINFLEQKDFVPDKGFYTRLLAITDLFEVFLDNSGAGGNKDWFFFRELVASIRNFVIAASQMQHLLDRYEAYGLEEVQEDGETFVSEMQNVMDFFNRTLRKMIVAIKEEGKRLGLEIPKREFRNASDERAALPIYHLPQNITEEEITVRDAKERIIDLSRRFRKVCKIWREKGIGKKCDPNKLIDLIPAKIDEKMLRKLKNIIHGVQSDYDTYVRNTKEENENPSLNKLRGFVSIALHLFNVSVWLAHFYERHENQIRKGESKYRISTIVSKEELLGCLMNVVIFYTGKYLEMGNQFADSNLTFYITKACYKLPIPKPQGFHARPATYVSLIVNEHGSDVFIVVDDSKHNARSVLSILEAGWEISEKGYKEIYFEGDKRVLDDLKILSDYNYCEDQDIPRELNYLRILRNL